MRKFTDIKPSNILLQNHVERVRISDFGIAQDISGKFTQVTEPGQSTPGTLGFESPEQNLCKKLDERTDIFSLGVTFYYMLTGHLPYKAANRQELALVFKEQTPNVPSSFNTDITPTVDTIVMKMIVIDPDGRYQNVKELYADMHEYLHNETVTVSTTKNQHTRAQKKTNSSLIFKNSMDSKHRRRYYKIIGAILLTFFLFGNFILYFWIKDQPGVPQRVNVLPVMERYSYVTKWGKYGRADGEFISPRDIAFDKEGYIYVTDNDNNRIQKFTSDRQFVTKWNCNDPMGIAVDQEGCVYVADASGNSILKFINIGGVYKVVQGWKLKVNHPIGISLDENGNIYVCEEGTSLVKKFSSDMKYLTTLDGKFNTPTYLDIDSDGNVYVADHYSDRIKKFISVDGINYTYKTIVNFNDPGAVAIDNKGNIYISGYNDNWIKKYTPGGKLVGYWGDKDGGEGDGQFRNPIGLEVNSFGYVYVVDHGNHRIQVFRPELNIDDLIFVSGGEFKMGNHLEDGQLEELPVHTVFIDSFYMGQYEVNNSQYCTFLNSVLSQSLIEIRNGTVYAVSKGSIPYCKTKSNSAHSGIVWDNNIFRTVSEKESHPIVMVSWYGAVAYCNWKSQQDGREQCYDLTTWLCDFGKKGYRLPTEAEWEYACRSGIDTRFSFGDNREELYIYGNYCDISNTPGHSRQDKKHNDGYDKTAPVGSYKSNKYGLYDMHGNVWEWCNDWYDPSYYRNSPHNNPKGPEISETPIKRLEHCFL